MHEKGQKDDMVQYSTNILPILPIRQKKPFFTQQIENSKVRRLKTSTNDLKMKKNMLGKTSHRTTVINTEVF